MDSVLQVVGIASLAIAVGCQNAAAPEPASDATSEQPVTEKEDRQADRPSVTPAKRAWGQTLYVPAYSHIYLRDRERSINLTTTLSIRNTSLEDSITLTRVEYFDSEGQRVRSYVSGEQVIAPLASRAYVVELDDLRGGVGANFIVRWRSKEPVSPPAVETVMITGASTQGISFLSEARVLYEEPAEPAGNSSGED